MSSATRSADVLRARSATATPQGRRPVLAVLSASEAATPPRARSNAPRRPRRARRRRRARGGCRPRGAGGPRRPRSRPPRRAGSRRRRCRTRRAPASARRAPRPCASVAAVARRMMSADVGPPSSIVAAWMTQRAGMSPAVVSTASPSPIGARAIALALHVGAAGARDRARHAAAVPQLRVRRVGDRVDLEGRDVGVEDLDRGRHAAEATRLRPARPCPAGARGRAGRRR